MTPEAIIIIKVFLITVFSSNKLWIEAMRHMFIHVIDKFERFKRFELKMKMIF